MTDTLQPFYADARPILVDGDPRLRAVALPVDAADGQLSTDIAAMFASLAAFRQRHGYGRALAAPQLGIARRIIALDLGAGPFALVNPQILWRSEATFDLWDDCFSLPDCLVRVRRHRQIHVHYRDARWRPRTWRTCSEDLAELLQHEIDHLDGILMSDRAVGSEPIRPATQRAQLIDTNRPAHRLRLDAIAGAAQRINPVFLTSPQFVSEQLSAQLGCRLSLKVETINPIRSFKGRGAELLLATRGARECGRALVCASAGNFGQALAYAARARAIAVTVFAAATANPYKLERMRALGADVRLHGSDFDAAKLAAAHYASSSGAELIEDGLQAPIAEGAGSIGCELLQHDAAIDTLLLPLGNGALLTGVARWIKAASPATRVIGVCSRGASAMADSWRNGRCGALVRQAQVHTIADGIAVREPIAEAVADMHGLVDDVVLVDDTWLLQAMRALLTHHGLLVEPAGAAGLAALMAAADAYAGQSVATVLCGGNIAPAQLQAWLGLAGGEKLD